MCNKEGMNITVKITIEEEADAMRLKLEGKVTGAGTKEFERAWRGLESSLDSKKLVVDLGGVIHMDSDAIRLLAEIYKKTGAQFVADSPMTQYFAEEAQRQTN
jgi:anti-anti-sigma factor